MREDMQAAAGAAAVAHLVFGFPIESTRPLG